MNGKENMLLSTCVVGLVLIIWARLYASQEVSIEGPVGWAVAAPTWQVRNKLYAAAMGGKTLTGYHLTMFFLPLIFLHLSFLFCWMYGIRLWTPSRQCEFLAYYFILCPVWDFLWFVLNPAFGLERFRRGEISWHKNWVWRIPVDYLVAAGTVAVLTVVAELLQPGAAARIEIILAMFAVAVAYFIATGKGYRSRLAEKIAKHPLVDEEFSLLDLKELAELKGYLAEMGMLRSKVADLKRRQAQREQLGLSRPKMG
jgi:hypothetical protein